MGLLLIAAVIISYHPVWLAGFVWDDDKYVTNNPLLSAPDGLKRIWFSMDAPSQYFPLAYTALRFEHSLWGFNAPDYHWVNILLHATNALLVWQLLKRLEVPGAWLAAAIFALHPVQVESVAWISELKGVLSLLFMLLATLAWVKFIHEQPERMWRWYALALIFYALALFSKTTACTLPAALLLILWLKNKRIDWNRLAQIVPFVVIGLGMGLVAMWWERFHQGTHGKQFSLGLPQRILIASHAFWFYIGKLLWPADLTFSYPRWTVNPTNPQAYGWLVAGIGLCAAIAFLRRFVGRGIEVATLFFALTLSPLLGFIMLYTFRYSFVADHYQYVACIGLIALAAAGITAAFGSLGKRGEFLEPVCCGALLFTLAFLTWRQCTTYANFETLMRATLQRNPSSSMAHNNLGNLLLRKGQTDEAIVHYQKSLSIEPNDAEPHSNLGAALLQTRRTNEGIVEFRRAVELAPNQAGCWFNLGSILLQNGQADQAATNLQRAVELNPKLASAQYRLALALLQKGRLEEAITHLQAAVRIDPNYAGSQYNLGSALLQKGRVEEAIDHLQKALLLDPNNTEIYMSLGFALYKTGQLEQATGCARQALLLATEQNNTSLISAVKEQIRLYETNAPAHLPQP
jgi:Flp pilus assembly protein TadD